MSFSVFAIGAAATGTGTLNPAVPAGTLTGKLMLLCTAGAVGTETITTPSGYTLIKQGSLSSAAIFGKIGTVSESAPAVAFSGSGAHAAFIVAISSTAGWPAIGSVLVDSSVGNNSAVSTQTYGSLAVTEEGLCAFQFGGKNVTTGGATAVAVTSGWSAAGTAFNNTGTGIAISAQIMNTSPTVAGDISQNAETITGNSQALTQRRITLTLKAASAGGYTYTATTRIDSPYNALWLGLLDSIGAFASGDTFQQNGTPTPASAVFTIGNSGYIDLEFDYPDAVPVTIPFIFNDSSAGIDYAYSLTFNPPPAVVPIPLALNNVAISSVGDNEFTLSAQVQSDTLPVSVYVVACEVSSPTPSVAQIVAGQNGSGVATPNGNAAVAAQGAVSVPVAGLAQEHAYDVWYVAKDAGTGATTPAMIGVLTTGSLYPAASVVPRKTTVTPVITAQFSMMDDGSMRAVDYSARRAYSIEITHQWITLAERDTIDAFIEAQLFELIDIEAADGHTYRCLLTQGAVWETASATRVHGSIKLTGNRR